LKRFLVLIVTVLAACQPGTSTSTLPPPAPTATSRPTDTPIPPPTETAAPTLIPTIPASTVELQGAEVPPGFSVIKFADLYRPTAFAFDTKGRMYVASQDGNIYLLVDDDKDGRSDSRATFASGYYFPLGVAVHAPSGDVYVSYQGAITVLSDTDGDGRSDQERLLVNDLPFDKHQNDNLEFGPDGWLYIGVGSTCDACEDPDPRSATILRFNVDTGESEIYATGMRNPFDIAFHPETGELFATDNGRDDLGMDSPFEELNHIVQGGDYGYPDCWNEQNIPGCEGTIPAVAFFEAHSSANGVDFYAGEKFPAEYRGDAFVSIFGSWLKSNVQTGIQRVVLSPSGNTYTAQTSWFIRFPSGGMPLPLLFGPDEALYVGDYVNDAIYRISYGAP
ncbi:MAG TPA: PQQ-dependent sugar dehydrogenase, partial [Anaerolineales bacterium]|nr:PQQ-dependent sugar dehydrogenase [Anaerolineales bacterium]